MDHISSQHPPALSFLFLTEMWERFGFYVVQGLLVLYMTQYFGFSDNTSFTILGVFTALAYLSPVFGGYLASHVLGFKTAVLAGGLFLIMGYALLALPFGKLLFYPALATIVVGNGLFKPSISSLLGKQYHLHDTRRESGFTIFYIGINLGSMLAGLSSGYIKDYFGWHTSFALASIGLVIGLSTFFYGLKYLKTMQDQPTYTYKFKLQLLFYTLFVIIALNFLFTLHTLANWLLPSIGIVLFIILILLTLQQQADDRQRMFILNFLILVSILFWMLFLQVFYSVNLFIERLVNKNFLGIPLSTTVFYASQSIFIILLGPFFAWSWQSLGRHDNNPSPATKFILGIFCAGVGFLILSISTFFPDSQGLINSVWILLAYFCITIGELLISPIGLANVTLLSPPHLTGLMMGVWFVAYGFAGIFAGMLAKLSSIPPSAHTAAQKLVIYHHAFLDYAYIAFFVTLVLFFARLWMKKLFNLSR